MEFLSISLNFCCWRFSCSIYVCVALVCVVMFVRASLLEFNKEHRKRRSLQVVVCKEEPRMRTNNTNGWLPSAGNKFRRKRIEGTSCKRDSSAGRSRIYFEVRSLGKSYSVVTSIVSLCWLPESDHLELDRNRRARFDDARWFQSNFSYDFSE